jgi:DNA/RNA-binding domain of Phe-tRNA-synthetase-like protein
MHLLGGGPEQVGAGETRRLAVLSAAVFSYDPAVLQRFPQSCAGIVTATVRNGDAPDELRAAFAAEQAAAQQRLADGSVADLAAIAAWRRTFSGFGVEPTKYRNAAESLLRRVNKKGDVPSISTLVDIGNLVSIRHTLPVAVIDAGKTGPVTVRFADGTEPFDDLGNTEADRPQPGEVIFVDAHGQVAARRWCWRQSRASATEPGTTAVLIAVEAQHAPGGVEAVSAAAADLADLLVRYAGAASADTVLLAVSDLG